MAQTTSRKRKGLSQRAVIDAAMATADEVGIDGMTIRKIAARLGVQPMSIYHHVADKDAILDGIVDAVFAMIDRPSETDGGDGDWRGPIRRRAASARQVLVAHPWAVPLLESRRTPGPDTLRHHDAMLGCLRRAGVSLEMTAHIVALIDAYVYGFAIQESSLPATGGDEMVELAEGIVAAFEAGEFPHLAEMAGHHVTAEGYDFRHEFDYGLDLLLDAVASRT